MNDNDTILNGWNYETVTLYQARMAYHANDIAVVCDADRRLVFSHDRYDTSEDD